LLRTSTIPSALLIAMRPSHRLKIDDLSVIQAQVIVAFPRSFLRWASGVR
jgi:hypothetical protein